MTHPSNPHNVTLAGLHNGGFQSLPPGTVALTNDPPLPPLPPWAEACARTLTKLHEREKHAILSVAFRNGRWQIMVSREANSGLIE